MHPKKQNSTAIMVFANSSQEELKHKAIANGGNLFDALTEQTMATVAKTGLPHFHFTEKQQVGTTFGERFTNAIQTVFDQGYENIITVGNDAPQLKTDRLLVAKKQLELGKTVLGPSLDGGFYLMGINKSDFDSETLKTLPWQNFDLLNKISDILLNADCAIFKLPILDDIDNLNDIKVLSGFIKSVNTSILQVIALILNDVKHVETSVSLWFSSISTQEPFNKGSPII